MGWGADLAGVGDVTGLVPAAYDRYTRGIVFGAKLADAIIAEIDGGPTPAYHHHYEAVNRLLDQVALKLVRELERKGALAFPVAASQTVDDANLRGLFQHKTAATRAGLGWVGRNGLLITPRHGPRVRLATVLTDLPLPTATPVTASRCGKCRACVTACPAQALSGELWEPGTGREHLVDAHRCEEWMATHYRPVGGALICGICIQVCPWGQRRSA